VAERLGAEIVSMDSMALYRGLDIGTAKATPEQRRRVPHHLIDVLQPWESASVAWWLHEAAACRRDIERRGMRVLFVGGTPLYVKALLRGVFDGPPADEALRQRLLQEAEVAGPQTLHDRLARVDPLAAARLHPQDLRRVVRALEVWELTGRPLSAWQTQWAARSGQQSKTGQNENDKSRLPTAHCPPLTVLCLDLPRPELYARINARVEAMIAAGWEDEVRALRRLPHPLSREASQALGYREIGALLDGRASRAETIARIQARSRQFAKRQLTWFRRLPECQPVRKELTFTAWNLTMTAGG
jgi:tRNA dimethylallyltransferase